MNKSNKILFTLFFIVMIGLLIFNFYYFSKEGNHYRSMAENKCNNIEMELLDWNWINNRHSEYKIDVECFVQGKEGILRYKLK